MCPVYDAKKYAMVRLQFWEMWSNLLLPLLPDLLWPSVEVPNKGLIYGSNRSVEKLYSYVQNSL